MYMYEYYFVSRECLLNNLSNVVIFNFAVQKEKFNQARGERTFSRIYLLDPRIYCPSGI